MDAAMITKRIRALLGATRRELAQLAGLSPSTIGRVEKGLLDPTWGTLSRILEATGYRINGDTVVSVGDPTAIAAARSLLEPLLTPAAETGIAGSMSDADGITAPSQASLAPSLAATHGAVGPIIDRWLGRWARAEWLLERAGADGLVSVAISAGNAGKIARRNVTRRTVVVDDGWRGLARRLDEATIAYAVTGLISTRQDRTTAASINPVIYVDDPAQAVARLNLEETAPGRGVLLIAPSGDELARAEMDDGIRFVSRAQGVLDAFAGSGREPDKAEDTLRSLLAISA